jgi:hypothetical protein
MTDFDAIEFELDSKRRVAAFAGANAKGIFYWKNEDFSIAHFAGEDGLRNRLDERFRQFVRHYNLQPRANGQRHDYLLPL